MVVKQKPRYCTTNGNEVADALATDAKIHGHPPAYRLRCSYEEEQPVYGHILVILHARQLAHPVTRPFGDVDLRRFGDYFLARKASGLDQLSDLGPADLT